MQLVCRNGQVIAWHDDNQDIAGLYPGLDIVPHDGTIEDLDRAGAAPPAGAPDMRPYRAPSVSSSALLALAKGRRKAEIDAEAERERLRHITPGSGQAMEYQQAALEASAYVAAGHAEPPPAGLYPMLEASVGIDGASLSEVAATVLAMHAQWQAVGSAIRAARLSAKRAIDAAADPAAVEAVTPQWPAA